MKNKIEQNWKINKQKHVKQNKAMYKTICKCIGKKEEKKWSIHGDDTNVLAKEFKPFAVKSFGKQINLLIISVNKLKSKSTHLRQAP